ncbi:hypothetical protein CcaverHIS002_0202930 [Cutaneotrichosporon cavernicola]|uniref:Uncharacterized protein n=1 Tax=Cutaneotrichosporon cavernicola TaxID=279322 RepID=A0AA48I3Z6_9TREE|nr:uncharacterized protein CcaverHIS019_0202940 [Cutaneotrichosporon cavernicola]BEI81133.1 hypothetical protein CcaverHIS002_0202930 [Cutaneotrichosporon cavernicola]BEI88932.1 hypothetical protein CcaverHIS019_0202940 [Cutaneotrichosporon cavernicola]BEI96709.1 hypothetical protein CcaverHIS631_0202980 [Cutaneotrichosporon cavernicola]
MTSRPQIDSLLEPRRQVALPDSPPLTPPQFKDQFAASSKDTMSSCPAPAPLTVSEEYNHAEGGPLNPEDIPRQSGHVGLGLGFSTNVSTAYMTRNKNTASDLLRAVKGGPLSGVWVRVPRRVRPILLAATSLVAIMLIFISRSVAAPPIPQFAAPAAFRRNYDLYGINDEPEVIIHRPPPPPPSADALVFETPRDELLALIAFITAATGNSLPPSVDPSETIDMDVLVGFDPAAPGAANDLEFLKDEVIAQHPLVLFGRMRDPWHQELVRALEEWVIVPTPLVVEVDERGDTATFEPVLERLLGTNEPQLVLAGISLGTAQDVLGLDSDELRKKLEKTELVSMTLAKKKKKHAAQAEKVRNHRVLRPQGMGDY